MRFQCDDCGSPMGCADLRCPYCGGRNEEIDATIEDLADGGEAGWATFEEFRADWCDGLGDID